MNLNKQQKTNLCFLKINTYLLGILFLYTGLTKLFVNKISGVSAMLTNLGFFLPVFFAYVLVIVEIGSGIMLFTGKFKKLVVLFPAFILLVAAFTVSWGNWTSFIEHIILATNLLLVGYISYK